MKKYIIQKIGVIVAGMLLLGSCTDNFDKINTDPNNPTPDKAQPQYILTYVLNRSVLASNQYQNVQNMNADEFAQFFANSLQHVGLAASNYKINDQYISIFWDNYYLLLYNLNSIIKNFSSNPKYTNVVQIARIWRVWMYQRLTDAYGDIPYFEAAYGTNKTPAYDSQKDIYYNMFEELKDAVSKFDNSESPLNPGKQDLVYGEGTNVLNNAKWIKYANTLRLRMAMRISTVDPVKAKAEAEAAIAAGVISKESESAYLKFGASGVSTGVNPINFNSGGMLMSTTMYKTLNNIGGQAWPASISSPDWKAPLTDFRPDVVDPRGPYMFDLSKGAKQKDESYKLRGYWAGSDPGLSLANLKLEKNSVEALSYISSRFKKNDKPFAILKYSETCFLLAEAALNGWNTGGTAQDWYEKGVTANFAEYGVAAQAPAYLANQTANEFGVSADFTDVGAGNTQLDKLFTQKWIALFPENSWDAWADFRRTGKPTLMVPEYVDPSYFRIPASNVASNAKAFIQRLPYPASEESTNPAGYSSAINKLGGADYQIQKAVWWDPNNQ